MLIIVKGAELSRVAVIGCQRLPPLCPPVYGGM